MSVARDVQATAQQEAYIFLRDKILSGEYLGGLRLNPAQIGSLLGISRMPVREALRQLSAEGLVTMKPNRGAVVTRLTALEVEELFRMRAALEGLAARYAASNITDAALAEIVEAQKRMDRARPNTQRWVSRHDELHQLICVTGQCVQLPREIARIRSAVQPYLLMYLSIYERSEMEGYEHESVIAAIAGGDPDVAERVMREHVMSAAAGIIDFLKARELEAKAAAPALAATQGQHIR